MPGHEVESQRAVARRPTPRPAPGPARRARAARPSCHSSSGRSPPGPFMCGSTTCSANPAATAASNAFPPRSSTAIPAARRQPVRRGHHPEGAAQLGPRRECHRPRNASLDRRMTLIDGKAIAQQVRAEVREEVAAWVAAGHEPPGLATVLVGDDAASARSTSAASRRRAPRSASAASTTAWPRTRATSEVRALLHELNADPDGQRHPAAAPAAAADRRPEADRGDRARQGRRRPDADLHRPAGQGPARACARARRAAAWSCCAATTWTLEGAEAVVVGPQRPRRQADLGACCWPPTPPSPPATRARATWPASAAARTCWSPPSACPS